MPYHIDEENSELAFEVREGNKLVIKIKSNIFSDSLELYLIKVGDNTEPTDKNVFSSLRVLKEIENLHDTILKEINSVTSGFWELKQDSQGNEYIATKYNVLTEGGLTTYGLGEQKLGTIYDGLPIDNNTIYWEEVEGSRVLKAKGSGGGSTGLDETKLWNVLGTPGDQQIDYSHLSDAFSQFSNEFVTIDTEQEITALKHFTAGLSIGSAKKKIYEKDGVLYIDSNVAITGALTMYATDGQSVSSIYDGLPIDNDTIYWETVEGSRVLKAKGSGGEAGSVQWGNISGKPTWIEDTKPTYNWYEIQGEKPFYTKEEVAAKFVTIDTEQDITALKHFTAGLSVGESKKKIYEENGVVYIDADVAVTGAMTFYATAGRTVSTIMDAVAVDGITITKEGNVLKAVSGSGSNFDKSAMWNALAGSTTEQINKTHLTTALDNYPTKTGSGASGTWSIDISGKASNADKLDGYNETDFFRINRGHVDSTKSSLLYRLNGTIVDTSTVGWSGMYAGFCASGSMSALVFRVLGGGQGMNKIYMNYSVDGSRWGDAWRIIATTDSNVNSATQLLNKRNIWGQPFNGTADITGDMSNINDINMSGTLRIYGTNPLFYPSFGGGWYMIDTSWIRVYGNKSIYTEGMVEANSGFMAYASYSDTNSALHKLDYLNCAFKNTVDAYVNHNSSRSILGWRDTVSGYGYSTRYVIGSERPYNGKWGRMYLAVGNNDRGTSIGCSIEIWGNGQATVNGNLLVTGGVTLYGSDLRYKSITQQVKLSLSDIANAPSFVYHWNREGMKCDRLNLGGSAQYTQSVLPWAVEENDNFLSMDYATVAYTFAVHTARHLLTYETRTDKKIKKLENRVKYLEKQLKKLGYEEVRTLDDQNV